MERQRPIRRRNSTQTSELSQLIRCFMNLDINEVIRTADLETTRSQRRRLTQLRQRNSADREWIPVLTRITRRQSQRQGHTEPRTQEEVREGELNQNAMENLLSMPYSPPIFRSHLALANYQSSPVVLFGIRKEVMIQENPPESLEAVVLEEPRECPSEQEQEEPTS